MAKPLASVNILSKLMNNSTENFWRHLLTAQIRTQWLHVHMLGRKYYLNYVNFNTVSLCLPTDFKPAFVAGITAGQQQQSSTETPWEGNCSRRQGTSVLCVVSKAGTATETLKC